ncbi:MAG: hypothetical protein QG650_480 [Patescibacteria group bacterium]|nr:hypothetical protein [Patescibacteria group bacterium]
MALDMHSSETLKNEVFGSQPNRYDLDFTKRIQEMIAQYSGGGEVAEAIAQSRIPKLLEESRRLSEGTAGQLAALRADLIVADGIGKYRAECTKLEEENKGRIAEILSAGPAANDAAFERAA